MGRSDIWHLTTNDRAHEVTVTSRGLGRRVEWTIDGEPAAEQWTMDDRSVLTADGRGAVGLHFTALGRTRRVTWFDVDSEAAAHAANQIPLSGEDFDPEPGSAAARRIEWMRTHPRLYTARSALIAAGGVLFGIVAVSLLAQVVVRIPWPDWKLPTIPWPTIPWPNWDLPSLPWPDVSLPDWDLPPWLAAIASATKYVVPVVIAAGIAYAEARRRRSRPADAPADEAASGDERR